LGKVVFYFLGVVILLSSLGLADNIHDYGKILEFSVFIIWKSLMYKGIFVLLTSFMVLLPMLVVACEKHNNYGGQTMVGNLKRVIVRKPDESFSVSDIKKWHYTSKPNLKNSVDEHDAFTKVLTDNGVEVIYHDAKSLELADSIYVHDPAFITNKGAIILKMGKELRRGEESLIENKFAELGVPILGRLSGDATAEGGDMLWLDNKTIAIGRSFRTNDEGIRQIQSMVEPHGVNVIPVSLPYDQGKEACLHLQSLISMVDNDLAVVYKKLLLVEFVQTLQSKGIKTIDVPEKEYLTMGPNILALVSKKSSHY
jgi:dimethylargininase